MAEKNYSPQHSTADGRFSKETPAKKYEVRQLSEGATKKIASVLHVMLNDKK